MTWLRIDDGFLEHDKIAVLSDRAFRLHMAALCYCARNLTDGRLNRVGFRVVSALVRAKKQHVSELQNAGLWSESDTGYDLNDYLEYNPDAATVKAVREARKQAGQRGGLKSGQARAKPNAEAKASQVGSSKSEATRLNPVPSRPVEGSNPVTATEDVARDPDQPGTVTADQNGRIEELTHAAATKDIEW